MSASPHAGMLELLFDDRVAGRRVSVLTGMVAVLLHRGGPMTLEELVVGVGAVRGMTPGVDPRVSVLKAWAGREPVVRLADGRFALDGGSRRMRSYRIRLGLEPAPARVVAPQPAEVSDDVPLTWMEVADAIRHGSVGDLSGPRLAAAVLDARGSPMTAQEIEAELRGAGATRLPTPCESPGAPQGRLVERDEKGRLRLKPEAPGLAAMRRRVRERGLPARRERVRLEFLRVQAQAREAARRSLAGPSAPPAMSAKPAKSRWRGTVASVQPRIRLTRSYDQRSHSYLGYVLRLRGVLEGQARDFVVAVGPGAHEKHQFRAGDEVAGLGVPVRDPRLETADLYEASALEVAGRGPSVRGARPPYDGVPAPLEEYRARGHRRLAAATYRANCQACVWGCEMAVEMIIDQWNPSARRYRRETFCYGPKSCALYRAGPTRKVPGRKGMSWEEADWVDDEATAHRSAYE